jgi:hypothetical protein
MFHRPSHLFRENNNGHIRDGASETLPCSVYGKLNFVRFPFLPPIQYKSLAQSEFGYVSDNLSLVLSISVRVTYRIITGRCSHLFISAIPSCAGNTVLFRAK